DNRITNQGIKTLGLVLVKCNNIQILELDFCQNFIQQEFQQNLRIKTLKMQRLVKPTIHF
ncbi:hypothetical protein ABPG74_008007, partial [Tetrahymena malaccensis]